MSRDAGPFNVANHSAWIAWSYCAALTIGSFLIGFVVVARFPLDGPTLSTWNAICRAIGLTADIGPANELQPPLQTPTRIAWTPATLSLIKSGNRTSGAIIALNCAACHGDQGVSASELIPNLAGMDRSVIFKQLDDYRSGKRNWDVMSAMASSLTSVQSADVAAFYAAEPGGLATPTGEGPPVSGHSLRQTDSTLRLVFVGDPQRGIPPCAVCHGPAAGKLGAPALLGQHADYIERQLNSFAQGIRRNDINEQMRALASRLTPAEMHSTAAYYGKASTPQP